MGGLPGLKYAWVRIFIFNSQGGIILHPRSNVLSVRKSIALIALASALALVTGCVAPFSDLQSAKLVGKGNFEVTPGYSSVSISDEGSSQKIQENYGVQVAYGVTKFMDWRLRYEYLTFDVEDETAKTNIIGFGPKFRLFKNWLAFYVPVGLAFGGDLEDGTSSDTWQVHPTLLGTLTIGKFLEINPSAKVMIPFSKDTFETLYAFNLGFAVSTDVSKWAIRPEVGLCTGPDLDGGTFMQFSIGFTLNSALFKK